jgi:acyl-CoA synthetase (AMP-forming)/AMP-acid ligase II/thioesterase domain-containing protein
MLKDTNVTTATASVAAIRPSLSLWQSLLDRAKAASSELAILAPHRAPLTNGDLLEHVVRVGAALRSHGIARADSVAVALPNGPEMATAFIAIATHAACAPLNPGYRKSEFEYYLDDLKPKALVLAPGTITPARQAAAALSIPVIDLVSDNAGPAGNFVLSAGPLSELEALPAQADDVALLLHTSGTTSRPKLVQLTQRNVLVSVTNIADTLRLRPADRCLNIMPLFHIHGLIGATLSTIASGGSLVCTRGLNVAEFFLWLEQFQPSWYSAVPTMHQSVLARARDTGIRRVTSSLRLIRSSSSPMPTRVMTDLEQLFGVPVLESYGMTEAAHQMTCNPLPPARRKPGSVGVPAGPEVAVLDDSGARLGPEQIGEIVIRGPNVTAGYRANPDANAASLLPDGWFRTGDLGRFDAEGYLYLTGRTKEMINRGGEKIAPREVEEALMEHAAVAQAVAFSMPHARFGEDVGAAVTLQDGQTVTERALRDFAAARLADFKVPRRILFLPELPKGATGKLHRIGLAKRLGITEELPQQPAIAPDDAMPQTKTELRVAACWMRTLKREAISLHVNFFDIGGDSLAALSLAADLEREMGVLIDVMKHPTIAAMAAVLEEGGEQASQRLYSIKPQGARPPLFLVGAGPLFRNLSLRLDPEQPVLSAVLLDYSRMPVPCRLEDIAAFHVETIRSVQPHGPYALGGWCVDGTAAYEAARQLRALGEEVALLILFDPLAPQGSSASRKWSWLIRRARFHLGQLRALDGPQAREYVVNRWNTVWLKITRRLIQLRYRMRPSGLSQAYIRDALAIQHFATAHYRLGPYDGRTLILRSVEKATTEGEFSGTEWAQSISALVETHITPGDHRSMFLPPEVDQTANLVERSLRAARQIPAVLGDRAPPSRPAWPAYLHVESRQSASS